MREIKMVLMKEGIQTDDGLVITKEFILNSLNTFIGVPIILIDKDKEYEIGIIKYPVNYINGEVIGNALYYEDNCIKNKFDNYKIDILNLLIGGNSFIYRCCEVYK